MTSSAAVAHVSESSMLVQSELLGPLTVSTTDLLSFPAGLFGLPECRSFVLLPAGRDGVYWLQSADQGALVFLLVDPFVAAPGYEVDVGPFDLAELQADTPADVMVLAIVTLPRAHEDQCTANLQGPLAINLRTRRGKQIAISESDYGVRYPISLPS